MLLKIAFVQILSNLDLDERLGLSFHDVLYRLL